MELRLKIRETDLYLLVDHEDWKNVRDVSWYLVEGVVTTRCGVTYEEYIDVVGKKNKYNNILDKRRQYMVDLNQAYEFSEYLNMLVEK